MKYHFSQLKPFHAICKTVLKLFNELLKQTGEESMIDGIRMDFSKGENGKTLTGLFIETDILEMLGARDYENIAFKSPVPEKLWKCAVVN